MIGWAGSCDHHVIGWAGSCDHHVIGWAGSCDHHVIGWAESCDRMIGWGDHVTGMNVVRAQRCMHGYFFLSFSCRLAAVLHA